MAALLLCGIWRETNILNHTLTRLLWRRKGCFFASCSSFALKFCYHDHLESVPLRDNFHREQEKRRPSQAAVLAGWLRYQLPVSWWGGQFGGGRRGIWRRVAPTAFWSRGDRGKVWNWRSPLSPKKASFQYSPFPHTSINLHRVSSRCRSLSFFWLSMYLSPDVTSWNWAVWRLPCRFLTGFSFCGRYSRRSSCCVTACTCGTGSPQLQDWGSPLTVFRPKVTKRAAGIRGLPCAVQDTSSQAEVLEVSMKAW